MPNTVEIASNIFELFSKQLDTHLTSLLDDLKNQIETMLAHGMDSNVIQQKLENDLTNRTGVFASLKGNIGSAIDSTFGVAATRIADDSVSELSDKFAWTLDPTVKEHCDTCLERDGQTNSYQDWTTLGLPGSGVTDCGVYCHCTLMPA